MVLAIILVFFLLAALGMPLAFTLGVASFAGAWLGGLDLTQIATKVVYSLDKFPLMAIPLFMLAGQFMLRGGIMDRIIDLANAVVEIADACSGFSTLYASMAFAFLLAYFSSSTKRRVMVLLLAAPIAVASNVARMVLLLTLVLWRGPEVLDTFIHPLSGMLTFAVALPVLLWIGGNDAKKPPRDAGPLEAPARA